MAALRDLEYVILDLETSGLYPERGEKIIEIGAVKMKGLDVLEKVNFQTLVDPEMTITDESIAIHGITNEQLQGQPKISEVAKKLEEFVAGSIPVAQNAKFDLGFLRFVAAEQDCPRLHVPYLDTMLISKNVVFHYTTGHNLDAIAKRLKIKAEWDRHRSIGDCLLTAYCLVEMIKQLEVLGKGTLKDIENCFVTLPKVEKKTSSNETMSLF